MTQLSGKTTTLEALLSRSKLTALTFRTKRGELGFDKANLVTAYFDEKGLTHWRALEGLLSATLEEKVQREPGVRGTIIRLCSGAKGLNDIYDQVKALSESEKKSFMRDVYTKILAYLDLVMPQLRQHGFASSVQLKEGLNMMDLEGMTDELQALIIFATIQWIYHNSRDTVVVMPEAWKFIPQDRGSPVKIPTEKFIREGAAIGNFLWIDSQDLRGVDKKFLRQIDNWILGRQRDPREIASTLEAIPLSRGLKPLPEEIMQLKIGHFIACLHDEVRRVYVQPAWLDEKHAKDVALGRLFPESVAVAKELHRSTVADSEQRTIAPIDGWFEDIQAQLDGITARLSLLEQQESDQRTPDGGNLVSVQMEAPQTELTITRREVKLGLPDTDLRAQLCVLMLKSPNETWTVRKLAEGLERYGWRNAPPNIVRSMKELAGLGLVDPVQAGARVDYRLVKEKVKVAEPAK
jgi:hypothetical protein